MSDFRENKGSERRGVARRRARRGVFREDRGAMSDT